MDLGDVMAEIGQKLDTITGLRVYPYNADKVNPPAAIVGLPQTITFDLTYGRGSDEMTLPVFLLVARINDRSSHAELADYLNGSGSKSVKAAVDSSGTNEYTSCDTVTVQMAEPDSYTSAGTDMLGAEFTVKITGSGS